MQAPSSHNDIRLRIRRHVQINHDEYNAALVALK
jgi:hypothetical protein